MAARDQCFRQEGAGGIDGGLGGQEDFEAGVAGLAINVDEAAVALDDPGNGGKPEAGALADILGGEERVENFVDDLFWYPAAGVGNLQHDVRGGGAPGGLFAWGGGGAGDCLRGHPPPRQKTKGSELSNDTALT